MKKRLQEQPVWEVPWQRNPYIALGRFMRFWISKAKESRDTEFQYCMAAILFSAFCIEGFLNFTGSLLIDSWHETEERKPPKEKLKRICSELGLDANLRKKPFRAFSDVFSYRKSLVHPKNEIILQIIAERQDGELRSYTRELPQWMRCTNPKWATRAIEETEKAIRMIAKAAGFGSDDPFNGSFVSEKQSLRKVHSDADRPRNRGSKSRGEQNGEKNT